MTDVNEPRRETPERHTAEPRSQTPGERRLDRPPSDRYRSTAADEPTTGTGTGTAGGTATGTRTPSATRGIAFGALATVGGAAAVVVLGGVLATSAGLLVTAGAIGYAVAVATMTGAGATLSRPRRIAVVVALALVAVALGQLGLWLYARTEGGVLALPDYLGQTFGPLVPLQLLVAGAVAWWTAR